MTVFIQVVLPVLLIFAAGYLIQKLAKLDIKSVSTIALYVMLPCLVFKTFYEAELNGEYLMMLVFSILLLISILVINKIVSKVRNYDSSTESGLILSTAFMNSGNYGAPIILFAFGINECIFRSEKIKERFLMRVIVTDYEYDTLQPEEKVMKEHGIELVAHQCKTEEEVIEACRYADGIISQYAQITKRVINELQQCQVIARYGIGYDSVDVEAASERGISVCNVTDYCLDEVSDHTMALLLSLSRKAPFLSSKVKEGEWDFNQGKPITRLNKQTLGLVGFGNIPRKVAAKAAVFGLDIVVYDPFVKEANGVKLVSFDELLKVSDYVSVHAPLNKQTEGMMNVDAFKKMKPNAMVINTARGPLIEEDDLIDALNKKEISGAALDVMTVEPPEDNHPLRNMDQVIITPHVAWYSQEAELDLKTKAAKNVASVLSGERPAYLVNPLD
ncbi:NAD(P)-dependent oxidoreductase [Halobacillus seohaensis]|uniref:NAD(P)-dependent oxidoreductase n=1 Tax=Halobacillus seohaensis TaxID=447421 RepID=A0ABW2EMJ7_9BACI